MKKILTSLLIMLSLDSFSQEVQQSLTSKAITEMQNENYTKALTMFNSAITKNNKDIDAFRYRALTKYKLKNYSSALLDINVALKLDSTSFESYEIRADIKYKLGNIKGCVADYEKAITIEPLVKNGENYYEVAKSKLQTKAKPSLGEFQPSVAFIEKVINSKLNFTDFYNQYYDNIESYKDANSLTYNEETKEHDKPEYTADIVIKYKGSEITFSVQSKTDKDPITSITITSKCICDWFKTLNSLANQGYSESKRDDAGRGALQIWATKKNFDGIYYANVRTLEKYIVITKK